jgi:NTP pyrophosphatase (non-canonical NTP hydrolase)
MAGECGEVCNLIKKLRRGESVPLIEIGDELADVVIYCDLLAARLKIDLGDAVVRKFNEVSDRRHASTFLSFVE